MNVFKNPVVEGFSPDPSVCAVGEDFYLVTSSFGYFPGVPIYHSRDLVNWKQIGNILDRESQLNLEGAGYSRGIFAPCIRYFNGTFYMITTNVSHGGNFVVTATDPAGPWSDPYFLEDAIGIDPSLFFDEDGRCYYVGTRPNPKGPAFNGDWEVWVQELDLHTMKLIGLSTRVWSGALRDVIWPEAPHLYKKDGYYYLLIAEGGTGSNHCITIARSENVAGPYIGNKNNPILTHRHLGKNFPVQNVGHGDLVETVDGKWYVLCLASRMFEGYSNLGRETFLAEVVWEDGWPVVNPGQGRLLEEQEHHLPLQPLEKRTVYSFDQIDQEFIFVRNPILENYDFKVREGWVRMHPTSEPLEGVESPTYIGLRQPSLWFEATTKMDFHMTVGGESGLAIVQNGLDTLRLVAVLEDEGHHAVRLIKTVAGEETIVGEVTVDSNEVELQFIGNGQRVSGLVLVDGKEIMVGEEVETHYLSTEAAGGFVGCTIGVYTTSTNNEPGYTDFEWIELKA